MHTNRRVSCPTCKHPYVGPSWLCGCCPHCRVQITGEDDFHDNHAGGKCLTRCEVDNCLASVCGGPHAVQPCGCVVAERVAAGHACPTTKGH